jgi:hypothetical protein
MVNQNIFIALEAKLLEQLSKGEKADRLLTLKIHFDSGLPSEQLWSATAQ